MDEALGMGEVGSIKGDGPGCGDLGGTAVVDIGWGEQADPTVAMRCVVPGEEGGANHRAPGIESQGYARS